MGVLNSVERRTFRAPAATGFLGQLDAWLRPGQGWSLSDEYPQVFGDRSRAFQHVLLEDGKLIAHAATLDLGYASHGHHLTIRLIGSVVVNPGFRGQGHGSVLLESIREDYSREAPELLMLWSDNHDFYERSGITPLGTEHILCLHPGSLGPRLGLLRRAELSDVPSLKALHEAKPCGTVRQNEDFEAYLRIPRCETWVLDIDNEVRAYASLGKGLDFPDHIHETGGQDLEIASLVSALLMEKGRDLRLLLPPYRAELRQLLLPSMISETRSPLGLGIQKSVLPREFYLEGFDSI